MIPEEIERFTSILDQLRNGVLPNDYESYWLTKSGERRLISWSGTVLTDDDGDVTHIIASGIDVTERKRLEKAVLDISAREQRRIGQDLHDGLGQHSPGIAFMGKVLQDRLAEASLAEASEAAKIVRLVNDSIKMTQGAGAGTAAGGCRGARADVGAGSVGRRGQRSLSRRLPLRVPPAGPDPRRDSGRSSLSLGAGSGKQRDQARQACEHHGSAWHSTNGRGTLTIQDDGRVSKRDLRAPAGIGIAHHAVSGEDDRWVARSELSYRARERP